MNPEPLTIPQSLQWSLFVEQIARDTMPFIIGTVVVMSFVSVLRIWYAVASHREEQSAPTPPQPVQPPRYRVGRRCSYCGRAVEPRTQCRACGAWPD